MSKFEGESSSSNLRAEEKEEKPPFVSSTKLKFKLNAKPETAIDHKKTVTISSRMAFNGVVSGEIPTCHVCFKTFRTTKSLHGHMRTHPERDYRGMVPPKKSSRPITSYSADKVVDFGINGRSDLIGVLTRGWPAEFRRGRAYGGASSDVTESCSSVKVDEDELVMGAVYGLMLLSTDRTLNNGEIRVSEISPPSNKKQRISGNGAKVETMIDKEDRDNYDGFSSVERKKKRKRMNNDETMLMKSYTCGTCGKCFTTPQALGGHTSSGHSTKIGTKSIVPEQVLIDGEHVCKLCKKAFSSGQALGGHMRLHLKAQSVAVVVVVEEDDQALGNEQVFRGFDLNEIPADD